MVITNLGANPLVLQIPIGSEDQFKVGWGGVLQGVLGFTGGLVVLRAWQLGRGSVG